ncbi:MAG TPA: DUF1249 domain-containing protein [Steroidobacteraceae bacterium]|nr:DUF1249 domain-containing protein [Steroidobacteraceae bacterium]
MSLYESNYLRFLHLAGEPLHLSGSLISQLGDGCELRLEVLERMPYTTMLTLTYDVLPNGETARECLLNLRLRAYRDARLLEADEIRRPPIKENNLARRGPHPGERELHQRWLRNMMLNKWLEYCAERGHRFTV